VDDDQAKSAILIPFPELDESVDEWREALDPSQVRGIPAHVTLLFPFVNPTELSSDLASDLGEYFSSIAALDVVFKSMAWFDDRVVYLEPSPAEAFVDMTRRLLAAYPSCRPYGGKFDEPIPHLTLGDGAPLESMRLAEDAVREKLPIATRATEAWLMTGGMNANSWSLRQRFPMKD
jgi:2'-5' RNA ligase